MPPCGSDGSLPSRPQWTALFDIVLSVFECMCIFSLFYYYFLLFSSRMSVHVGGARAREYPVTLIARGRTQPQRAYIAHALFVCAHGANGAP